MGMLFIFTGIGLLLFIAAVAALIWSIRSGQLDDLETPAMRMLTDDAAPQAGASPAPDAHRSSPTIPPRIP